MIAKITVSVAVFAIDKAYSYKIPPQMQLEKGMRVLVPFGRGNKKCEGIVLDLAQGDEQKLKPVERVLDEKPLLSEQALRLAAFVRRRYFCTFYDAVRAILPAGLWFRRVERIALRDQAADYQTILADQQAALTLVQTLQDLGGSAELPELSRLYPQEVLSEALSVLKRKKLIKSDTELLTKTAQKTEKILSLAVSSEQAMAYAEKKRKSAPLQKSVLELLSTIDGASASDVCAHTGATMATIRRLADLGLILIAEREVLRGGVQLRVQPGDHFALNFAQKCAFEGILKQHKQPKPGICLLHGVTGSGKTAVYVELIYQVLSQHKSAILLVPEIALTPQLLSKLTARFGSEVAVLHSSLKLGERYDEWRRIKDGKAHVVVGTRSAVFAPVENLGLIILDEEQEHTYKSENTPRYHAKEVAIYRGASENALVLLGSATPSVESMWHAKTGDYSLFTLHERYNGMALPRAEIADLRAEIKSGNDSCISKPLYQNLRDAIAAGKQSILFLNRRGSAKCLVCVDCGQAPSCPRCSVSLTYHSASNRLMCHYCGYSEPYRSDCPLCGGRLKSVGYGTQKVEQELLRLFPDTKVLRMDADTVSASNSHEAILNRFSNEKIPILLGTQMVTKGLDFENVTLVGVLDADLSLYVNSFRAPETTFSLITQVVGRSGRGEKQGKALIQTMTPDHPVIRLAAEQDYYAFYEMEIAIRKMRAFPPFSDIIMLTFTGQNEDAVLKSSMRMRKALEMNLQKMQFSDKPELLGPAPAPVVKVNYTYRYRITLQTKLTPPVRDMLAFLLLAFSKDAQNRGVGAYIDINSYD